MKQKYGPMFFVVFAIVLVLVGCACDRNTETPLLLYVTSLPNMSHSIAVIDPRASTCSEPTYIDTTLQNVESAGWLSGRDQIEYVISSPEYILSSLWIMEPDGSNRRQIIPSMPVGFGSEQAHLSHDQRYAAFLRSDQGEDPAQWEIDVVDTRTGTTSQLMSGVWTFEWSPTDDLLAVSRWYLNDSALYIVRPDGTVLGRYQNVILSDPYLIWSPDGHQTAFSSSYSPEQGVLAVEEIYVIDLDSGQQVQLTQGTTHYQRRQIVCLSWSPDGKQIAFVSNHTSLDGASESDVLFVIDARSGREIRLADDVEWSVPVWSPDSKEVAFVSTMDGSNYGQIYLADVSQGIVTQLTCDDRIKKSLSW
jgi:Tol biopolymer transport system component